jgi:hypothetical protein
MAKLTIERSPSVILNTQLNDSVCERLWNYEKKQWRGKRESSVDSWQVLIEEIFDSYLKSKGY